MRKLVTKDVFAALRLVQKSGLKEQLVPVIEKLAENPESIERSGIIGVLTIVEVFTDNKCENLIYEWLASPFETTPKKVGEMELEEFMDKLTELVEGNDLHNFFTSLLRLISAKH